VNKKQKQKLVRRRAITLQNNSSIKLSMTEAINRVMKEMDNASAT
jgi:hypothetical protein